MTAEPVRPDRPLAGPPEPWDYAPTPCARPGPPYHMTDMIAAEPALARRLIARLAGAGRGRRAGRSDPRDRRRRRPGRRHRLRHLRARGAWRLSRSSRVALTRCRVRRCHRSRPSRPSSCPWRRRARSRHRRLARGRDEPRRTRRCVRPATAGAQTAVVTVSGRSPAGALADIVVETGELDQGWCHTVGYLSPIVAARGDRSAPAGRPPRRRRGRRAARRRQRATRPAPNGSPPRWPSAATCSSSPPAPTGRPGANWCSRSRRLRGCRRPTAISRRSCTATCRRPDPTTGLVLILDRSRPACRATGAGPPGARRGAGHRPSSRRRSWPQALDAELDPALTPAGRLLVPEAPTCPHRSRPCSGRRRRSSS